MGENSVPGAILDYNHKPAAVTEAGKPLPTLLAVGANIISNAGSTLRCAVNSPLHCRNTKKSTLHCRNTKKESIIELQKYNKLYFIAEIEYCGGEMCDRWDFADAPSGRH